MLGRFLELSIVTPDIRASLDFYLKLGFSEAAVGEAWSHPYAVVTDGRIYLGLHADSAEHPLLTPALTFVRPDLLKHLPTVEGLNVRFEFRHLGNDVFNEVGWLDPSGNVIRLIEARTFSPTKRSVAEASFCGYFLEIGLPSASRSISKTFWERLGFVGMDEEDAPLPHVSCTSDTVDIGLYDPADLRRPTLIFESADVGAALLGLADKGITPAGKPSRLAAAALLIAPEGTPLLVSVSNL